MKKLLIIDGNHLVHRAYHAYPQNFTSPDGRPVGMVYGWCVMFLKALEIIKPTHVAICFDRPAPTFRKTMYAGYQANRPQMESELSDQIVFLQEALTQSGFPQFGVDGYEADDLIGTLALQAEEAYTDGDETIILSGDRDLLQLVDKYTKEMMPLTGITNFQLLDPQGVKEKMGVGPEQIVDYKALVGDASDGYPGITGIGPKTAITLLEKYATFERVYEHLDEISPRVVEKLTEFAEQGAMSKKLAQIVCDAPVHLRWDEVALSNIEEATIASVFEELGFSSLARKMRLFAAPKPEKKPKVNEHQLSLL